LPGKLKTWAGKKDLFWAEGWFVGKGPSLALVGAAPVKRTEKIGEWVGNPSVHPRTLGPLRRWGGIGDVTPPYTVRGGQNLDLATVVERKPTKRGNTEKRRFATYHPEGKKKTKIKQYRGEGPQTYQLEPGSRCG